MRAAERSVVLIEDDALVRTLLKRRLQDAGWHVIGLSDGRKLEEVLAQGAVDLIVLDLGLPFLDGLALLEGLRARGCGIPVLVLTAYQLPYLMDTVRGAGANDLVQKPYDQEALIERMQRLLAA
ncbi:MAG: response regulator transcription factor [Flavobacteriales bacterium]|nr:response regulator transcription factor [Flavobacteriales bacterium]